MDELVIGYGADELLPDAMLLADDVVETELAELEELATEDEELLIDEELDIVLDMDEDKDELEIDLFWKVLK